MIFKSSFTKWVEVIAFVSLSVRLFQRRGPREDTANLIALNYILGSMKLLSLGNDVVSQTYSKTLLSSYFFLILNIRLIRW